MSDVKRPLINREGIWYMEENDSRNQNGMKLLGEKEVLEKNVSLSLRYAKELTKKLEHIKVILKTDQVTKEEWIERVEQSNVLAERIVTLCRGMTVDVNKSLSSNGQPELDELLLSQSDVRIGYTPEGWFYLRIPALLPHKEKGHSWYLTGILWAAFDRWQKGMGDERVAIGRFTEKCVIAYRTTYHREFPSRRFTDFDNFEYKAVTDMIAGPLLVDDGPKFLTALYLANTEGDENYTEVFLFPERQLPEFYEQISQGKVGEIQYQFRSDRK